MTIGNAPLQVAGGKYNSEVRLPSEQDCCAPFLVKSQFDMPTGLPPPELAWEEDEHAVCSKTKHAQNIVIKNNSLCLMIQWMSSSMVQPVEASREPLLAKDARYGHRP